jgi:AraC-like DNA-binding protein
VQVEQPIPVPPPLRPWFSTITAGRLAGPARTVQEPPDHAVALTLRTVPGAGGEWLATGPRTVALYSHGVPGPSCLTLRIRPGRAAALLGGRLVTAPAGLTDRAVPLSELSPRLADELASGLVGEPVGALLDRLAAALPQTSTSDDPVAVAAELLGEGVAEAARRLHLSERHLRTLFVRRVGIAPKRFARIERVRTVLARAPEKWRDAAADAGYADQSHLTAEFRRLMGVTPTAWAADRLPPPRACR